MGKEKVFKYKWKNYDPELSFQINEKIYWLECSDIFKEDLIEIFGNYEEAIRLITKSINEKPPKREKKAIISFKYWSDKEESDLYEQYSYGIPIEEICKSTDRTLFSIIYKLKWLIYKNSMVNNMQPWSEIDLECLLQLYQQGISIKKLSRRFGRSERAILLRLKALRQNEIKLNARQEKNIKEGYPKNHGLPWTTQMKEEVLKLYHQGISIKEICDKFERNKSSICSLIEKQTGNYPYY